MQLVHISGGRPLSGTINASGSKNALTKLIVASLLSDKKCTFFHVPEVGEVEQTLEMCREIGMEYCWDKEAHVLEVETAFLKTTHISHRFSGSNRVPILMIGALLGRSTDDVFVPMAGEESSELRPFDFHVEALRALGAEVDVQVSPTEASFYARAPNGLKGAEIRLPYPSVGATENTILAAVTAKGTTIIRNAAIEPEIIELVLFLQKIGAYISIEVDRTIVICGSRLFHPCQHTLMTDRVEVASYAMAALATNGSIFIKNAQQSHMVAFLNAVREIGAFFSVKQQGIEFWTDGPMKGGIHLETDVHPGFITNWQQSFVVLLTQCYGSSIVHETVYENRLGFAESLSRMGANISLFNQCLGSRPCRFDNHRHAHCAVIKGACELSAMELAIPDLRAGFAYVIAALIAQGKSTIHRFPLLENGYDHLVRNLRSLGAEIEVEQHSLKEKANTTLDLFETLRGISQKSIVKK